MRTSREISERTVSWGREGETKRLGWPRNRRGENIVGLEAELENTGAQLDLRGRKWGPSMFVSGFLV